MTTVVSTTGWDPVPQARQIQRIGTNHKTIVAFAQENSSEVQPYASTDGGSTWAADSTTISSGANAVFDVRVDSTDTFHMVSADPADNTIAIYNQFTVGSSGSVTMNVTDEQVYSGSLTQNGLTVTIDSSDIPWVTTTFENKVMGTSYENIRLFDRSGGSWTSVADPFTGSVSYNKLSIATDSTDRISIVANDTTNIGTMWNRWDPSTGSLNGAETVTTNSFIGSIATTSNDNPLISNRGKLYRRVSGVWESTGFTSKSIGACSVCYGGSDIYVIFDSNGDIYENHNTFSGMTAGDETAVVSTSASMEDPSTRWQYYNENDPSTDVVDILIGNNNSTDDSLDYTSISVGTTPGAVRMTDSTGAIKTTNGVVDTQQ